MHQLEAFCEQFNSEERNPCDVAAGMGDARDETSLDWIGTDKKYNWNYLRRRLSGERPWRARPHNDNGHFTPNQIRSQCRQPIVMTLCPSVFDRYIAALHKSCGGQTLFK